MKASAPTYKVIAYLARLQSVKMTEPERCRSVLKVIAGQYSITRNHLIEIMIEQLNEWRDD